jgi:hypothetical protein
MNQNVQPDPIRTTTANEFAHRTMTHRLPKNIRNVIEAHPEYPESVKEGLRQLAQEIASDAPLPAIPYPAWDGESWDLALARRTGESWQDTDWFFAETYAFRLILSVVRYFETTVDPYAPMKQRELDSGSPFLPVQRFFGGDGPGAALRGSRGPSSEVVATQTGGENAPTAARTGPARAQTGPPGTSASALDEEKVAILEDALHLSMWGNKADISFHAGGEMDHSAGDRELLLADQGAEAAKLLSRGTAPVNIVMDNSGAELAGDLALALTINRLTDVPVTMHLKFYPTYVSDTVVEDVHIYLEHARSHEDEVVSWFAGEVQQALDEGRILLAPDQYWCETEFLSAMPPRIAKALSGGALTIVKGDFNYRRAFQDTIWDPGMQLDSAMGLAGGSDAARSTKGTPWLFLRTMKSDCLLGVDREQAEALDRSEPGWRTDGRRGVIQFIPR